MEIYIDEAGSFVSKEANIGSWCVIAAFVIPETEKRRAKEFLRDLKIKSGFTYKDEIKLYQICEKEYFTFLSKLNLLKSTLFAVATDSSFNSNELVIAHKEGQVKNILSSVPQMKYEEGKEALKYLASQINSVSPQLYIQLTCQVQLMSSVVDRAINYYVQRIPNTLGSFKWRIDNKDPNQRTDFEDAFVKFSPALLQTFSLKKPRVMFSWCDYSPMKNFIYQVGEIPDYLIAKFPYLKNEMGLDIQKIIREDIKFDSKLDEGVQIADLLASGLRRLLRGEFKDNVTSAKLFGGLFVQETKNSSPLKLTTFDDGGCLPSETADTVRYLIKECRAMAKN